MMNGLLVLGIGRTLSRFFSWASRGTYRKPFSQICYVATSSSYRSILFSISKRGSLSIKAHRVNIFLLKRFPVSLRTVLLNIKPITRLVVSIHHREHTSSLLLLLGIHSLRAHWAFLGLLIFMLLQHSVPPLPLTEFLVAGFREERLNSLVQA